MQRLPAFIDARQCNWQVLRAGLDHHRDVLEFALPTHATAWHADGSFAWDASGCRSVCSWFGFSIAIKAAAPFTRTQLAQELDRHQIGNRMLFGGNLVRQPAFVQLQAERPDSLRVVGDLPGSDAIMKNNLFLGVYPGLTPAMLQAELEVISAWIDAGRRPVIQAD